VIIRGDDISGDDGIIRIERAEWMAWLVSAVVVALGIALILMSWPWGREFQPAQTLPLVIGIALFVTIAVVSYLRARHQVGIEPKRIGVGTVRREPQWFDRDNIRLITVRGGPVTRIMIHDRTGRRVLSRGLIFLRAGELRQVISEAGLPLR
jgi:hypothetical protein